MPDDFASSLESLLGGSESPAPSAGGPEGHVPSQEGTGDQSPTEQTPAWYQNIELPEGATLADVLKHPEFEQNEAYQRALLQHPAVQTRLRHIQSVKDREVAEANRQARELQQARQQWLSERQQMETVLSQIVEQMELADLDQRLRSAQSDAERLQIQQDFLNRRADAVQQERARVEQERVQSQQLTQLQQADWHLTRYMREGLQMPDHVAQTVERIAATGRTPQERVAIKQNLANQARVFLQNYAARTQQAPAQPPQAQPPAVVNPSGGNLVRNDDYVALLNGDWDHIDDMLRHYR